MTTDPQTHGLSTLCIHAGTHLDQATGGVFSPIFSSTGYVFPNPANTNTYPRYFNTRNQQVINRKLAAIGKRHNGLTVIDNTLATAINQNPIPLGIDAVIHSTAKYLNGHSDVSAGVLVAAAEIVSRVTASTVNFGGVESLICVPSGGTHRNDARRARACRHQRRPVAPLCRHRGCARPARTSGGCRLATTGGHSWPYTGFSG